MQFDSRGAGFWDFSFFRVSGLAGLGFRVQGFRV